MPTVNVTRVASALNLSEQRVQQLVKEGMPRESRGQYDPVKCMFWYIRYLQNAIERRTVPILDGVFAGERQERIRLLRVAADLKEAKLAKERSQLVAVPDAEAVYRDLALTTERHIMAVAPRVAPELVGETSRVMIQAKLDRALKDALKQLARSSAGGETQTSHNLPGQASTSEVGDVTADPKTPPSQPRTGGPEGNTGARGGRLGG